MSEAIMVCGSRSMSNEGVVLVGELVRSIAASGAGLVVGCASGADAAALQAAMRSGLASRLSVFAAFGMGGEGAAGGASAVGLVQSVAASGVPVQWWAGGASAVPLRARLARRSLAAVKASGSLVSVVSALPRHFYGRGPWWSCGSGSWSSVAAAASLGLPVVVVPVGFSAPLPGLPCGPGHWSPVSSGVGAGVGFQWEPAPGLFG